MKKDNYAEESLKKHYEWRGKIEIVSRVKLQTREDLSLAYTPGVAEPCLAIQKDISKSYDLTRRADTIAIITDGTAVLGLGDIGAEAAMPVMEGKAVLFKELAGIDAIPLCIRSKDVDDIVNTVALIAGSFGGINLEDISAPRCFEIERRLTDLLDIPVFHDDQHGTAIVVLAAVINALRLTGKESRDLKLVINGAGAAGTATKNLLLDWGVKNLIICDKGDNLAEAVRGADILIGLSVAGCFSKDMIRSMNTGAAVFAMANPVPEIMPNLAKEAGALIVATGRSDFPNQINNALAFPGVLRGALNARAGRITEEMKIAAAYAVAECVSDDKLSVDYLMPDVLDKTVAAKVAEAVFSAVKAE